MTNILKIIKKLLFLSEEICSIYDEMADLSTTNQENSITFNKLIEHLDSYLSQETEILESMSKDELIAIIANLFDTEINDRTINRCYITLKDYFEDKYPYEEEIIDKIEYAISEGNAEGFEMYELNPYYEDDEEIKEYRNHVRQKVAISAIKKMYHRIKITDTENKIDHKYKKTLLKFFKEFKYYFFTLDRNMELLGVKYHFDINQIPEMPKLEVDTSSISYNECIDILDSLYYAKDSERDPEIIEENLFEMLMFEEHIKELTPEQIDKLINICYDIESTFQKNLYGNIGLQKLIKSKKN